MSAVSTVPQRFSAKPPKVTANATNAMAIAPFRSLLLNGFIVESYCQRSPKCRNINYQSSEGIADCKVEGECLLEGDVEISVSPGVVGSVEAIAEVTADHNHAEVQP